MVPVGYEAVTLTAPLPAEVDVVARRRADSNHDVLIADLTMPMTAGRAVLDIEGLTLRAVADTGNFAVLDDTDIATPLPAAGSFVELAERLGIRGPRRRAPSSSGWSPPGRRDSSSRRSTSPSSIGRVVEDVAHAPTDPGAAAGVGGVRARC